jgi:putative transposase
MMAAPESLQYGEYYRIYNRGNAGENIFREERNYRYFLKLYARHIEPVAETFAYCLLRNHFHVLVRIRDEPRPDRTLETWQVLAPTQQFSNLFNAYAKAINKTYGRTGSLFQRPFGRIRVDTTLYALRLVHYIHFNPQKHAFVADFRDYPYSSYQSLLSDGPTRLNRDEVLDWFDGHAQFAHIHQTTLDEKPLAALVGNDFD